MKRYVVIAGVNGAGKTTFYSAENTFEDIEKVNLDEIVRSIGNWKNPTDVVNAGKMAVNRIASLFKNGISFSQETTLCGNSIIRNIRKAKEAGYSVELYYIGVDSPEIAKLRVKQRVKNGGHGVSDEDVERRYYEGLNNLKKILPLCDKAIIYNNSNRIIRLAVYQDGICKWKNKDISEWYKRYLN